jgi:hypothetical protein
MSTPKSLTATLLALSLTLPLSAAPTPKPFTRRARARPRPVESIMVKVMPEERFHGSDDFFRVSTVDGDSCVAWVDAAVVARDRAMLDAFKACRAAVAKARAVAAR